MEVLLLRHSSTQGNLEGRYVGSQNHPLAVAGIKLAHSRKHLMPVPDKLWVSPMLRCRQTGEILFPNTCQYVKDSLRECNFGDFEGKTWDELKDNLIFRAWINGNPNVVFPNGESLGHQLDRCHKAVSEIIQEALEEGIERICILAHGGTLMSIMSEFCVPRHSFYHWLPTNCGGFLVSVNEDPMTFYLLDNL